MNRYIDADKLIDKYERAIEDEWNKKTSPSSWADAYDCVIADIDDVPTADVVEVKHGEWTKSSPYNRFMNCSVCGFGQDHTTFKYCPNCGAKMDGERSENGT